MTIRLKRVKCYCEKTIGVSIGKRLLVEDKIKIFHFQKCNNCEEWFLWFYGFYMEYDKYTKLYTIEFSF